ncbi:hypothetical protein CYMTET_54810 [Cymbomonas tetramitiformis]|uniref:Uncharacterized protein n=1 Tax=Cymbomonas tetramitiformis TaxID=36881 RepID=A0AAE0BFD5_9CHLO|nr:hypothetical protein CYMTET_54810 [Cymbomonas tetramitiformis]
MADAKKGGSKEEEEPPPPPALCTFQQLFQYATMLDYLLLFLGGVASVVVGFLQPVSIVAFGDVMDTAGGASTGDMQDDFDRIALTFVGMGLVAFVSGWTYAACFKISGYRQAAMWRKHYFEGIVRQDTGWFDINDINELPSKISETTFIVEEGVSSKLGEGVRNLAQGAAGVVVSFWYMWDMALVMLVASPISIFGAWLLQNTLTTSAKQTEAAYGAAGSVVSESLSNIRTIASLQAEPTVAARYDSLLGQAETAGVRKSYRVGFASGLMFASGNIMVSFGFLYGGFRLVQELDDTESETCDEHGTCHKSNCASDSDGNSCDLKGSDLLIAMFAMQMGSQAIGLLEPFFSSLTKARQSARRILDTVNRAPPIDIRDLSLKEIPKVTGRVIFQDVEFAYPSRPDSMICNGFNLTIEPGESCALVGQSGCGKSTSIQLMERFYDPLRGRVLLDGADLREVKVTWLREKVGLVGQEPVLFSGSVQENIALGKLAGATLAEVQDAAKMANAHDFITTFADGYDTDVGHKGSHLSGGQKQRIAIARAIIKNPVILLLDEATSALDNTSERLVQAALESLMEKQRRTTIIIAHRLTTIRNSDKIVVVEKGRVVEEGTHTALMAIQQGEYRALVEAAGASEGSHSSQEVSDSKPEAPPKVEARKLGTQASKRFSFFANNQVAPEDEEEKKKKAEEEKAKKKEEAERAKQNTARVWAMQEARDRPFMLVGTIGAVLSGGSNPAVGIIFVKGINFFYSDSKSTIREDSIFWTTALILMSLATLAGETMRYWGFGVVGERLTRKLRKTTYEALLKQEVAWFDEPENAAGILAGNLSEDVATVQALSGESLGRNVLVVGTLLVGLGLTFVLGSPVLSAVALALIPVITIGMALEVALMAGGGPGSESEGVGKTASGLIGEIVSSQRTVASFVLEGHFIAKFQTALDSHLAQAKTVAAFKGFFTGFSQRLCYQFRA